MPTVPVFFNDAWVLFIFVTIVNAFFIKVRSRKMIASRTELREGYDRLFQGYLIFMNIPWVVMGAGILFGGVQGVFNFFLPRAGGIFVQAFHAAVVILWALCIWWVYFRGGAEFLIRHPGVLNQDIQSPLLLKVLIGVSLAGGAAAFVVMWSRWAVRLRSDPGGCAPFTESAMQLLCYT